MKKWVIIVIVILGVVYVAMGGDLPAWLNIATEVAPTVK